MRKRKEKLPKVEDPAEMIEIDFGERIIREMAQEVARSCLDEMGDEYIIKS